MRTRSGWRRSTCLIVVFSSMPALPLAAKWRYGSEKFELGLEADHRWRSADIEVSQEQKAKVAQDLMDAGIEWRESESGSNSGEERLDGWEGGRVWLVPTSKEISEWEPVAERMTS